MVQQREDLENMRGPTCKLYILYDFLVCSHAVSLGRSWNLPSQQQQPAQAPNLAVSRDAATLAVKVGVGVVDVDSP
jgi:hypothetical protein